MVKRYFVKATVVAVAFFMVFESSTLLSAADKKNRSLEAKKKPSSDSYKESIEKARLLTLQRKRVQASQTLQTALARETKNSTPYREIARLLDELTGLFYTEKAQMLFSRAESVVHDKPQDAVESYQAALALEAGNVSIMKAQVRAHLRLGECRRAGVLVKSAEMLNPVSSEVRLLRLQTAECSGQLDVLASYLGADDIDMEPVEMYLRAFRLKDLLRRKEIRRARQLLAAWESANPDYPEVYYWKWKLSADQSPPDRSAAAKYVELCGKLSPRKKKSFDLDLELCKGRERAEEFLKSETPAESAAG